MALLKASNAIKDGSVDLVYIDKYDTLHIKETMTLNKAVEYIKINIDWENV